MIDKIKDWLRSWLTEDESDGPQNRPRISALENHMLGNFVRITIVKVDQSEYIVVQHDHTSGGVAIVKHQ